MPSVTISSGPQAGRYFKLGGRPLCVGRDATRDIQIIDPKVSRKHAMLRRDDAGFLLCPLRCLNGVLLNGTRIDAEARLHDGDVIRIGDTGLRFSVASEAGRTNAVHQRKVVDPAVRGCSTIL